MSLADHTSAFFLGADLSLQTVHGTGAENDGKVEDEGGQLPPFPLPITLCSRSACSMKIEDYWPRFLPYEYF